MPKRGHNLSLHGHSTSIASHDDTHGTYGSAVYSTSRLAVSASVDRSDFFSDPQHRYLKQCRAPNSSRLMHVPPPTFCPAKLFFAPGGSDADIEAAINNAAFDACSLEFDFELSPGSLGGTLQFQYIFMSEEYNEYVGDKFNDGFLLLIDGENVAKVSEAQDVVSINTINNGANPGFYNDNEDIASQLFNTEYDGFTTLLSTSSVELIAG